MDKADLENALSFLHEEALQELDLEEIDFGTVRAIFENTERIIQFKEALKLATLAFLRNNLDSYYGRLLPALLEEDDHPRQPEG